jgi:hypothetical protein
MAGRSRSKNGVAALAYVPAIHAFHSARRDVDARDKRGHDGTLVQRGVASPPSTTKVSTSPAPLRRKAAAS